MVGVVILNYNGSEDTIECVRSFREKITLDYHLIIVDNNSEREESNKLESLRDFDATIIYSQENLGYAGGNNIGIKFALEKRCNYICVLNNDTIIEENFLVHCIKYLEEDQNIAFIGPTLLNMDNDYVQSTGGDVFMKTGRVTLKNNGLKYSELPEIVESDYIGGACIVCRSSDIEILGLIPENYFLFFEETEWCYRAKIKGYKNVTLGNTFIRHKGLASIGKIDCLSGYLMERNRVVFVKRNASNKINYIGFLFFYIIQILYYTIRYGKKHFIKLRYFFDGVFNRISKKYPFIKITD